jgi:hypothetical protein
MCFKCQGFLPRCPASELELCRWIFSKDTGSNEGRCEFTARIKHPGERACTNVDCSIRLGLDKVYQTSLFAQRIYFLLMTIVLLSDSCEDGRLIPTD